MLPMTDAPLATYRYTLTRQDALAYENLRSELPGPQRVLFFIWLGLAGMLLAALPEEVAGPTWSLQFCAVGFALLALQYGLYVLARTVTRYIRARRRYPEPVEVSLEEHPDHLVVAENGKPRTVPFTEIGMILPTATHLFMAVGRDLVIVPQVAFGDAGGMTAMVEHIDGFMREKYAASGKSEPAQLP